MSSREIINLKFFQRDLQLDQFYRQGAENGIRKEGAYERNEAFHEVLVSGGTVEILS